MEDSLKRYIVIVFYFAGTCHFLLCDRLSLITFSNGEVIVSDCTKFRQLGSMEIYDLSFTLYS